MEVGRDGGIGDGGIGEGGFQGFILRFSLTLKTFKFTVPPAAALLNEEKLKH
jgi:hypothetical protein